MEKELYKHIISHIDFKYEHVEQCLVNGIFVGLRVTRDGKVGFLRHEGNPFNLMYMGCKYDYLEPIINKSSFPNGTVHSFDIFFVVEINKKWGIQLPNVYDTVSRVLVSCKYDSIRIIKDYPSMAIVRESGKETFFNINTRTEYRSKYEEVVPCYPRNGENDGLFYACVKCWSLDPMSFPALGGIPRYYSDIDIFDIAQNTVVDHDRFEYLVSPYEKKNGTRWAEI